MPKGNPQPRNFKGLALTNQIMDYLRSIPNPKGIPEEFLILKAFLKHHEEPFIQMHGKECFDEHMMRYNRNASEMKRDKLEREKERREKSREKLELKKREIIIKERDSGDAG